MFGFEVPVAVPGVDPSLLDPRSTWADPEAYDAKARELAAMFRRELRREVRRGRRLRPSSRPGRASSRNTADGYPTHRSATYSVASSLVIAKHDVLVVGAGCAGMRAAIEAHDAGARRRRSISKLHPTRSHSGAAEGGINAALGNAAEDSPETHAFDTVKGSDYLGDQDAIEIFTAEAPGDIYQLEHWGAVFSRNDDGKLAQRPFGAAGSPRTVFAADITGHVLIQVLYEQLQKRMDDGLDGLRGVLRLPARGRRRPLHGRRLLGPAERRRQARHRQGGRSSPPAARAASTARRRTRTRAPATGWRWRCARVCR